MNYDLVIKNGTIVTATSTYSADIGLKGERIAAIGQQLTGHRLLDATGKMVTPGAVDIHVHMQMPIGNFTSADDFYSGTVAAAFGGTTSIIDFVERERPLTFLEAIAARRAQADPRVVIDYGLHMTLGPHEMDLLDQLPDAFAAGCISFKLYMAYDFCLSDSQMLRALQAVAAVDGLPVVHAENWDVICDLVAQNLAQSHTSPHWHPRSRPAIMEGEATGRVIDIANLAGTRIHIFHVSSPYAVLRISQAREAGQPVTGETCPQYLLLGQELFDRPGVEGALPVCSPPIRDKAAQDVLWSALGTGELQLVTTDHCPFTRAEKASGLDDYSRIPGGVPSVEMRFPALYTYGVFAGRITLNQWIDSCCTTPARLAGLTGKGDIQVGYDADLVIFDPQRTMRLSTETLHEQVDWTPYEGLTLRGWPAVTISRGEVIVEDDTFLGQPGRGRYAPRSFG
jgi:dihydropyrimidinase